MNITVFMLAAACVLTNAADVTLAVHKSARDKPFVLRGMISPYVPNHSCFLLTDASGSTRIEYRTDNDTKHLQRGDIVHVKCRRHRTVDIGF